MRRCEKVREGARRCEITSHLEVLLDELLQLRAADGVDSLHVHVVVDAPVEAVRLAVHLPMHAT